MHDFCIDSMGRHSIYLTSGWRYFDPVGRHDSIVSHYGNMFFHHRLEWLSRFGLFLAGFDRLDLPYEIVILVQGDSDNGNLYPQNIDLK